MKKTVLLSFLTDRIVSIKPKRIALTGISALAMLTVLAIVPFFIRAYASGTMNKPTAEATSKQVFYLTFDEQLNAATVNTANIQVYKDGVAQAVYGVYLMPDQRVVKGILVSDMVYGYSNAPVTYWVYLNNVANADNTKTLTTNDATNTPAPSFPAFTPHGKYSPAEYTSGNGTRLCGLCHLTHSAVGGKLLSALTIQRVCFVCHGPAGSRPAGLAEPDWTVALDVYTVFQQVYIHKALDTSPNDVLTCIDCHNPHGDRTGVGNNIYPRLLRSTDGTAKYYQGNGFCLACHGSTDRAFAKDAGYYAATGGNHTSNNAAHYSTTIQNGAMLPASGTQVTCSKCHEEHGSPYSALIDGTLSNREEALCFKSGCHGTVSPVKNIYDQFYGTGLVSRHRVEDNSRGKVECSSCHGPHTVTADFNNKISNPDNTKQLFGMITRDFCLKCHDGTPPTKTTNATTIVPYSVYFNDIGISTNSTGWDKSLFANSGHGTSGFSVANCTGCHEWHGSRHPNLIKDDPGTGWQYGVDHTWAEFPSMDGCLGLCHRNDVSGAGDTNIYTPFSQTYKHPTFTVNGVHDNTENWGSGTLTRHAECADCHDVHTAKIGAGQTDVLGRVSGVKYSQTAWDSWASATATPVFLDPATNNLQAYLCYKCHSKYAGNQPNPTPSSASGYGPGAFAQTDVAKEFNPSNKARHVVEGTSQMPTFTYNSVTYYYGKFINGWTATSQMKCTDCHMPATGAKGPHGSATRFILKAAWNPTQTATMTSSDLCFLCHDYGFYYSGTDVGSTTVRSQFSGGSLGYNGHATKHKAGKQKNCSNCHGGLPHGWKYTDSNGGGQALWSSTDARPYKDGSYMGAIPTYATRPPGQWTSQHSGTSCGNTGGCT